MLVADVLARKGSAVVTVSPEAHVSDVAHLIATRRIGAVVVLHHEDGLVGILSERDIVIALHRHGGRVLDMTAEELMTRNVVTATPETEVDEAVEMMDRGYFRHLPVMEDRVLAGIISIRDLMVHRQAALDGATAAGRRAG